MSYKKLVRDNIPDIIRDNGEIPIIRTLSDTEYKVELEKKLLEECKEVIASAGDDRIEELGDLLEVIIALAKMDSKTLDDIVQVCNRKRKKRGAFDKRIYLEMVDNLKN